MDLFKQLTIWLASGVEAVAAVLIGLAAIEAALRSLPLFLFDVRPGHAASPQQDAKEAVRLVVIHGSLWGLSFKTAACCSRRSNSTTGPGLPRSPPSSRSAPC